MSLVVTRRIGEAIVVDGPAVIRIASDQPHGLGNRVRLLIEAERETTVLREELVPERQKGGDK